MKPGFTVALIGADGSGKTSVARCLPDLLTVPSRYIYMGVSLSSSNRLLPTTRLVRMLKSMEGPLAGEGGPPDPDRRSPPPPGRLGRVVKAARTAVRLSVVISEEWYRQALAWWHVHRGRIVIFDRHFFVDFYAYDITRPRSWAQRLHGWMLARLYPRPQLVVFLDAPSEVSFARKAEGSPELLERRRQDYLAMGSILPDFAVVDATQPMATVLEEVVAQVEEYARSPRGGRTPQQRGIL